MPHVLADGSLAPQGIGLRLCDHCDPRVTVARYWIRHIYEVHGTTYLCAKCFAAIPAFVIGDVVELEQAPEERDDDSMPVLPPGDE